MPDLVLDTPSADLLAFVRSRVPLLEHDGALLGVHNASARERRGTAGYALTQAVFYAADAFVGVLPLVSRAAHAYAEQRWGTERDRIWSLRRSDVPKVDRLSVRASGLLYEHVTTGAMFRAHVLEQLHTRGGTIDAWDLARWLQRNYRTAWITREEDARLTARGFRSRRGRTLADALACYEAAEIAFVARPLTSAPTIEDTPDDEAAPAEGTLAYRAFFALVSEALGADGPRVAHGRNNSYAAVRPGPRGVDTVLLLDGPRGARVRTPTLSFEARSAEPFEEPDAPRWRALRGALGADGTVSFGRARGKGLLCRLKVPLTHAFDVNDVVARADASARTAAELHAVLRRVDAPAP